MDPEDWHQAVVMLSSLDIIAQPQNERIGQNDFP